MSHQLTWKWQDLWPVLQKNKRGWPRCFGFTLRNSSIFLMSMCTTKAGPPCSHYVCSVSVVVISSAPLHAYCMLNALILLDLGWRRNDLPFSAYDWLILIAFVRWIGEVLAQAVKLVRDGERIQRKANQGREGWVDPLPSQLQTTQ